MTQDEFKPVLLRLLSLAQHDQNVFFQALSPAELEVIGEPDTWSAKDHVAHLTFWRQRLALKLQAHLRQEPIPQSEHFEKLNPIVFAQNRYRIWPDILSESDRVYTELISLTEQLTEEDLTTPDRLAWMNDGDPLYLSFMGNCYEHSMIHLGYYLVAHHEIERAITIYQTWSDQVINATVPDLLKGYMLYNLACFYATHDRLEPVRPILQQAFELYPAIRDFAPTDPDLSKLYANHTN